MSGNAIALTIVIIMFALVIAAEAGWEALHITLEILHMGIESGIPIGPLVWFAVIAGVVVYAGGERKPGT